MNVPVASTLYQIIFSLPFHGSRGATHYRLNVNTAPDHPRSLSTRARKSRETFLRSRPGSPHPFDRPAFTNHNAVRCVLCPRPPLRRVPCPRRYQGDLVECQLRRQRQPRRPLPEAGGRRQRVLAVGVLYIAYRVSRTHVLHSQTAAHRGQHD